LGASGRSAYPGYRLRGRVPSTDDPGGNEALALGAVRGVQVRRRIPDDAGSGILLGLSWMAAAGLVFEQAEDEIAA